MNQLPTKKSKKETTEEKLIRLEKEFNEKIQKDPKFKEQINRLNKSFRDCPQNYKEQIDSVDKQIIKITEELDTIDIDSIKERLSKKNIDVFREETNKNFNILREELKKDLDNLKEKAKKLKFDETNFGLEVLDSGNFKYKRKFLKISTDSNSGKFLKHILEDKNDFISDEYCQHEFNCPTVKEITYIIRDLNKTYLSKDNLKAKLRRCRDAKGYILEGIVELKS